MGIGAYGQICFGVLFKEGYEFPWKDDWDIENWWRKINNFYPPVEFNPIMSEEDVEKYLNYVNSFPVLPVEPINYGTYEFPAYILAIPNTIYRASEGYPTEINPKKLLVNDEYVDDLLNFCKEYKLEFEAGPAWFLTSLLCD